MTSGTKLPRLWQGYLTGSNRGRLWLRLKERGGRAVGSALFFDRILGHSIISLEGSRQHGAVSLRIRAFESLGPPAASPLDGEVNLQLSEDFKSATGNWKTDLGTMGTGSLSVAKGPPGGFLARLAATRARFFWRRHLPSLFTLLVAVLVALAVMERIKLSTPILILILIPAPYVFRRHIAQLIQAFRLKRFGPVEFGEQSTISRQFVTQLRQAFEETKALAFLDGFFVPRTKALLALLASRGAVSRAEFDQMAEHVSVPPDNVVVTLEAIVAAGCAAHADGRVEILEWGKRYVRHLGGQ